MINANEIKKGSVLKVDGDLFKVVFVDCHTGGGKAGAMVNTKIKNMSTGHISERKFAPHERVENAEVMRQKMDFMYTAGDEVWFMNPENYEQISLTKERLGPMVAYLTEGMKVDVEFVDNQPAGIIPPELAQVKIASTSDPVKGETDSVYKSATLENGQEILVPQFIKTGDVIHVYVETGEYVDRVK